MFWKIYLAFYVLHFAKSPLYFTPPPKKNIRSLLREQRIILESQSSPVLSSLNFGFCCPLHKSLMPTLPSLCISKKNCSIRRNCNNVWNNKVHLSIAKTRFAFSISNALELWRDTKCIGRTIYIYSWNIDATFATKKTTKEQQDKIEHGQKRRLKNELQMDYEEFRSHLSSI